MTTTTMALRAPIRQLARRCSLVAGPTSPRHIARQQSTASGSNSGSNLGEGAKQDIAVSLHYPLTATNWLRVSA